MQYRAEAETLEGKFIVRSAANLAIAKQMAKALSKEHITAYAVAVENETAVGHVAFGDGRQGETAGILE